MSRKKRNIKAAKLARGGGTFLMLPDYVRHSVQFVSISPLAAKLLADMMSLYRYGHNGDISAPWSRMKLRGWKSKSSLQKAIQELDDKGLIVKTRVGGRNRCSLFALGWIAIDHCNGKLDVSATTKPLPQT